MSLVSALRLPMALAFLAAFLIAAPASAAPPLTPDQRQAVEQVIHDYLMNNPKFLVEVLKSAQEKMDQEEAEQAKQAVGERRDELIADPTSPVGGNPEGDVTIVEFFDYRCPYCKQVEPALAALLHNDPKLRIVYKEFPILGPDSVYASRVALAARKQGKYEPFHAAMMAAKGQINDEVVLKVAASVGLDVARVKSDMESSEVDIAIQRAYALAQALQIHGTPAFVIGGEIAPGAADIGRLKEMVAAARKSG